MIIPLQWELLLLLKDLLGAAMQGMKVINCSRNIIY